MPLPLVPASAAELGDVATLVNSAYRGDSARLGWTNEADLLDGTRTDAAQLRADLAAKPGAIILLLRDAADGPLLGCVWLEPAGADIWFLGMLTVRPDLQDRQLGRVLIAGAEAHARGRGARAMRMSVISVRETLIAWYERRGYARTGETAPFDHAATRTPLTFVYLEKPLADPTQAFP